MSRQTLLVIGGFAGTGKSTLARRLATALQWPVFDSDTIGQATGDYVLGYRGMYALIDDQLDAGLSVIVDSNMGVPLAWERLARIAAARPGLRVLPVLLETDWETCRARAVARLARDPGYHCSLEEFDGARHKFELVATVEFPGLVRVDGAGSPDEVYETVIGALES